MSEQAEVLKRERARRIAQIVMSGEADAITVTGAEAETISRLAVDAYRIGVRLAIAQRQRELGRHDELRELGRLLDTAHDQLDNAITEALLHHAEGRRNVEPAPEGQPGRHGIDQHRSDPTSDSQPTRRGDHGPDRPVGQDA
jgi:hypothetical protein